MTFYLSFLLALQNDISRGLLVVVILMAIAFGGNYFISNRRLGLKYKIAVPMNSKSLSAKKYMKDFFQKR